MNCALLNCPFCNSPVEMQHQQDEQSHTGQLFFITCYCGDDENNTAWQSGSTAVAAANKWNTRHDRLYDPLIAVSRLVVSWLNDPTLTGNLPKDTELEFISDMQCLADQVQHLSSSRTFIGRKN